VAVLAVIVLGLSDGGGGELEDLPTSSEEVLRRAREENPVRLTVSVSGDLLIHSPVYQHALALGGGDYDFTPLFKPVRPYVKGVDLAFCHVETPMSPAPPQGYPVFNTPPELARAVTRTGWDACDTASNHTLDQGQEGVEATLRALDRAGVAHTGSYASARASENPLILEVRGVRVALLAYTTDTNGIPLPEPWSVNLAKPARILADAREARRRGADAVLVNMHWGIDVVAEYSTETSREQEQIAKRLTDAPEITAVVGQGPHIVQPIRSLNGKFVVFSEGNLVSNQDVLCCPEGSQDGLIALLDLVVDGDGARVEQVRYVPIWVSRPDYEVLPVGPALGAGQADPASLRASYERTVEVAGRGPDIEPQPPRLPQSR
jgi:poly-gamma-glutamate capsule biosynthesis protein CapA/YwtB (metallophosphatase superfamily)